MWCFAVKVSCEIHIFKFTWPGPYKYLCIYIYVLAKELHSEEQIGWWLQHWCGSLSKSILCLQVVC